MTGLLSDNEAIALESANHLSIESVKSHPRIVENGSKSYFGSVRAKIALLLQYDSSEQAHAILIHLLHDKEYGVRLNALSALFSQWRSGDEIYVIPLTKDPNGLVQTNAISLIHIKTKNEMKPEISK